VTIAQRSSRRLAIPILVAGILLAGHPALGEPLRWSDVKRQIRRDFPTVSQISTAKLAKWLKAEGGPTPLLLDVREAAEYDVSHLKGARRALTIEEALEVLRDTSKGHPIVLYCSVGHRSSELAAKLQKAGYTNVHNLEGSIFQWRNEGRPLYRNGKTTTRVHPYDDHWGQLLEGAP
jgi:rhodanese-related sulfurtransferase